MSDTPFYTEAAYGWRFWKIVGSYLTSLNEAIPWDRIEKAACREHERPPVDECGCGIYALTSIKDEIGSISVAPGTWNAGGCFGKVALWGKVIEYEGGFRAEFAAPVDPVFAVDDLMNYTKYKWDIAAINERYDINIIMLGKDVTDLLDRLNVQQVRPQKYGTSAHQLRETRLAQKPFMSISTLADKIGKSTAWVSNVERGVITCRPPMQKKIADVFGMKVGDIFTRKEDKQEKINIFEELDKTVLGPYLEELFG